MTSASMNRSQRQTAAALSVVLGFLLVSCDKRVPPAPSDVPPSPPQSPRSTGPIAFVSDRDGTERIYLSNEDGSLVSPLVTGSMPAWAKDGRQIAFSAGSDIRLIGVDGSGERIITRGAQPTWSPDGRSLVFTTFPGPVLEIVNVDGSNRHSLFNVIGSGNPKWSPDGQKILYVLDRGFIDPCFGLWIVNADGSGARQLGGPEVGGSLFGSCEASLSDGAWPAWSPDGSEIAFVSANGGWASYSIHVVRADGSGRRLRVPAPAFHPDWTPDGRLIYAKGQHFGPSRIFINDGGTERQLIPDAIAPARPAYGDSQPVWLR